MMLCYIQTSELILNYLLSSSQLLATHPSLQCSTPSSVQNMSESSRTFQCGTMSSPPVWNVISPKSYDLVSNRRHVQFPSEFQSQLKLAQPSTSCGMSLPGLAFLFTKGPFLTDSKGNESLGVQPRCSWKLERFLMPYVEVSPPADSPSSSKRMRPRTKGVETPDCATSSGNCCSMKSGLGPISYITLTRQTWPVYVSQLTPSS